MLWAIQVKQVPFSGWNSTWPTAAVGESPLLGPQQPGPQSGALVRRRESLGEMLPGKREENSGDLLEIVEVHSEGM